LYCGPPDRFYCSDHRCAHFAEQIAREAKAEAEKARNTGSPKSQRNMPEWVRWFLFLVMAAMLLLTLYEIAKGN
jgi:hypothetical protein